MVPPSSRKKFSVPVTMPNWCGRTAFWISTVVTGYMGPMPPPPGASRQQRPARVSPVGIAAMTARLAIPIASPAIGKRM